MPSSIWALAAAVAPAIVNAESLANVCKTATRGLAITSGSQYFPTGIIVGAVSGITDGGFGCSGGGREGCSQAQRFTHQFDGLALARLFSDIGHTAISPTDGVIARSDLCKTTFDFKTTVGQAYYFTAKAASSGPSFPTPTWSLSMSGLGDEWVARYLQLRDTSDLVSVTADTLRDWMPYGMKKYIDSLKTTHPELGNIQSAGGRILHIHGEDDDFIPAASSVQYYDSVRSIVFPCQGFNESGPAISPPLVKKGAAPATLKNTGVGMETLCRWFMRPL
ncbi:tannase [Colletotrichum orchidophilum]|uniref:Carboxylic ester hydrolase n=1 Tax=Colletotrichum orchidophilum TaxID=1209926 RepID=A0A1G4B6E8_9PEZI|nr:tannase [Colletotrichum orchidophilum]OHE96855.1 tannase [Colletotrichum orchidophilum]